MARPTMSPRRKFSEDMSTVGFLELSRGCLTRWEVLTRTVQGWQQRGVAHRRHRGGEALAAGGVVQEGSDGVLHDWLEVRDAL
jgi:hypothetical protein